MAATRSAARRSWSGSAVPRLFCLLLGAVALLCLGRDGAWIGHAAAQAEPPARPGPMEETPEALPEGEGREETFCRCTACHGTAVFRARACAERWEELMDWSTDRQGMPPLEGEERRLIVDYLAGAFPPQQQRRRGGGTPSCPTTKGGPVYGPRSRGPTSPSRKRREEAMPTGR